MLLSGEIAANDSPDDMYVVKERKVGDDTFCRCGSGWSGFNYGKGSEVIDGADYHLRRLLVNLSI